MDKKVKEYLKQFYDCDPRVLLLINEVAQKVEELTKPQWVDGSNTTPLVDGCQYLVKNDKEQSWCEICTWNKTYQCWDDSEGDDIQYESVDLYMEIPE